MISRKLQLAMMINKIVEFGSKNELLELSFLSDNYFKEILSNFELELREINNIDQECELWSNCRRAIYGCNSSVEFSKLISDEVGINSRNSIFKAMKKDNLDNGLIYKIFDLFYPSFIAYNRDLFYGMDFYPEVLTSANSYSLLSLHDSIGFNGLTILNQFYCLNLSEINVNEDFKNAPVIELLDRTLNYKLVPVEEFYYLCALEKRLALRNYLLYFDNLISSLELNDLFCVFLSNSHLQLDNLVHNLIMDEVNENREFYVLDESLVNCMDMYLAANPKIQNKLKDFYELIESLDWPRKSIKKIYEPTTKYLAKRNPNYGDGFDYFSKILNG